MAESKMTTLAGFLLLVCAVSAQTNLVPETLTPLELWNIGTWFYPFGIAGSNAWGDYLKNAQEASNQLYKRVETASAGLNFLNGLGGLGIAQGLPQRQTQAPTQPQTPQTTTTTTAAPTSAGTSTSEAADT